MQADRTLTQFGISREWVIVAAPGGVVGKEDDCGIQENREQARIAAVGRLILVIIAFW